MPPSLRDAPISEYKDPVWPQSPSDSATELTSLPSDGDSSCDDCSSLSLEGSQRLGRKKSVRFSFVQTREYNVVEELLPADSDQLESARKSLGWDYTERESDVESHIDERTQARKKKHDRMLQNQIHDHIQRAESRRRMMENKKQQQKKKKGFKSRVLKPLWRGFVKASSQTALATPSTPH